MTKGIFRKTVYLFPLLAIILFAFSSSPVLTSDPLSPEQHFREKLIDKSQALIRIMKELEEAASSKKSLKEKEKLRSLFLSSRDKYKEIETFIIHFFPGDAFAINQPDLVYPEEDDEVSIMFEPHGFQVLERLIFTDSSTEGLSQTKSEIEYILKLIKKWPDMMQNFEFPPREIFEAAQLGMIRIYMFGLTNIETPHCKNAFPEAYAYTSSLQELLSEMYVSDSMWVESLQRELYPKFDALKHELKTESKKVQPDYFNLYSNYYIPASEVLVKARHFLVPDNFFNTTAINLEARSIFDPGSFNTYFFVPGKIVGSQKEVTELGRTLFFDPALSSNNERACGSCHKPDLAFTDGLPVSRSFEKQSMLERNAPGLINAVLQKKLFHDGRSFSFENQASEVLNNPDEMHADFAAVALKLRGSSEYVNLFRQAFRDTQDTLLTGRSILMAIAEYERSLIALNSRFDKTMRGHDDLMTEDEKQGFNLYMGKANCASCHFIPLFNGTVPPEYVETEMEVIGVPGNADIDNPIKDKDPGREAIVPMEIYRGAFKTPALRNSELTAPYMHNGVFQTLEEVVEFYDRGGGRGIGLETTNQTMITDSLHLSPKEKMQLVLFLKTLTDTVNTTFRPTKLPLFENDPELNQRHVGGEY